MLSTSDKESLQKPNPFEENKNTKEILEMHACIYLVRENGIYLKKIVPALSKR